MPIIEHASALGMTLSDAGKGAAAVRKEALDRTKAEQEGRLKEQLILDAVERRRRADQAGERAEQQRQLKEQLAGFEGQQVESRMRERAYGDTVGPPADPDDQWRRDEFERVKRTAELIPLDVEGGAEARLQYLQMAGQDIKLAQAERRRDRLVKEMEDHLTAGDYDDPQNQGETDAMREAVLGYIEQLQEAPTDDPEQFGQLVSTLERGEHDLRSTSIERQRIRQVKSDVIRLGMQRRGLTEPSAAELALQGGMLKVPDYLDLIHEEEKRKYQGGFEDFYLARKRSDPFHEATVEGIRSEYDQIQGMLRGGGPPQPDTVAAPETTGVQPSPSTGGDLPLEEPSPPSPSSGGPLPLDFWAEARGTGDDSKALDRLLEKYGITEMEQLDSKDKARLLRQADKATKSRATGRSGQKTAIGRSVIGGDPEADSRKARAAKAKLTPKAKTEKDQINEMIRDAKAKWATAKKMVKDGAADDEVLAWLVEDAGFSQEQAEEALARLKE